MLPSIKDMYNCTRENHDYNTIRCYQGSHKNFANNSKPTKKDHYLDWSTRLNCSPGPASIISFTQTQQTSSQSGTRRMPFNAKGHEKRHTQMKLHIDRRKIIALLPTTTRFRWDGPRKENSLKIQHRKSILLILVSMKVIKFQVQEATI